MTMTIKVSTALAHAVLVSGSMKTLLDGGFLYLYSGTAPATADAAIGTGQALLVKISKDAGATGLSFGTTPAAGKLGKNADTWSGGTPSAEGTATFYRWCMDDDDGTGAAGVGDYRVQGSVATSAADLNMENPVVASSSGIDIDDFGLDLSGWLA